MPAYTIDHTALTRRVEAITKGIIATIVKEETAKAVAAVEARIAGECSRMVVKVVQDQKDYRLDLAVNVVISLPDAPKEG